jgi:HTH-type transcriptional regulator/antitoxin HigA
MSTLSQRRSGRQLPKSYLALLQRWPLRPIESEKDYESASKILDELVLRADLEDGEADYLGALELLIEAYDESNDADWTDRRKPHERLQALMDSAGRSQADLEKALGASQTLVSMIVNGKRDLSKRTIVKLADYFRVDPGYFL